MIAGFKMRVVVAVTCFGCDVPKVATIFDADLLLGERLPCLTLPNGWINLDGRTYCERHSVSVFHQEKTGQVVIDFPRPRRVKAI